MSLYGNGCNIGNVPDCPDCEDHEKRIRRLEKRVADLTEERDEARREAEIERDRYCHPDNGGHLFPWERDGEKGGAG